MGLLGAFAALAPNASAVIQALDADDTAAYRAILGPTEELSRQVFAAPTYYYKAGVAFLSWLNGHQAAFQMVGGLHAARSLPHLSRIVELANASGALERPELAAARWHSLLTLNGLVAAQYVLIPMQCEYYALEGLSDLVGTIKRVRAHLNPALDIAGLVRTMYDARNTLAQQVSAQLEEHFGDKVYRTIVPRNVRLAEAPSYGTPAVVWDAESKGAQAYTALAHEMLERATAATPA